MAKVVYVTTDEGDWAGVYANGKLVHEGHDIPSFQWLDILQRLGHETDEWDGTKYATENGNLPKDLEDLTK